MNRNQEQAKSGHIVIQVIKNFISKIRQNPDVYPIRYYKKNKRFRSNVNGHLLK